MCSAKRVRQGSPQTSLQREPAQARSLRISTGLPGSEEAGEGQSRNLTPYSRAAPPWGVGPGASQAGAETPRPAPREAPFAAMPAAPAPAAGRWGCGRGSEERAGPGAGLPGGGPGAHREAAAPARERQDLGRSVAGPPPAEAPREDAVSAARAGRGGGGGSRGSSTPSPPPAPEVCNGSDSLPEPPATALCGRTAKAAAEPKGSIICGAAPPAGTCRGDGGVGAGGPHHLLGPLKGPNPPWDPSRGLTPQDPSPLAKSPNSWGRSPGQPSGVRGGAGQGRVRPLPSAMTGWPHPRRDQVQQVCPRSPS